MPVGRLAWRFNGLLQLQFVHVIALQIWRTTDGPAKLSASRWDGADAAESRGAPPVAMVCED